MELGLSVFLVSTDWPYQRCCENYVKCPSTYAQFWTVLSLHTVFSHTAQSEGTSHTQSTKRTEVRDF